MNQGYNSNLSEALSLIINFAVEKPEKKSEMWIKKNLIIAKQ